MRHLRCSALFIVLVFCCLSAHGFGLQSMAESSMEVSSLSDSTNIIPKKDDIIDVVYTWVNGSDTDWKKEHDDLLESMSKKWKVPLKKLQTMLDERPKLFFSNDELKFSLRSLHASLKDTDLKIGNIYIVTNNQKPSWLDTEYPHVKVVDHKDIFRDKRHVPSFSTFAIEVNLHHIPNLRNHFIYFNDDFFVGRPLNRATFIDDSKKALILRFAHYNAALPKWKYSPRPWARAQWHTTLLLNKQFPESHNKTWRYVAAHVPLLVSKTVMNEIEDTFASAFKETSGNRFRGQGKNLAFYFMYAQYMVEKKDVKIKIMTGAGQKSYMAIDFTEFTFNGRRIKHDTATIEAALARAGQAQFFNLNKMSSRNEQVVGYLNHRFPTAAPWEKKEESHDDDHDDDHEESDKDKEEEEDQDKDKDENEDEEKDGEKGKSASAPISVRHKTPSSSFMPYQNTFANEDYDEGI